MEQTEIANKLAEIKDKVIQAMNEEEFYIEIFLPIPVPEHMREFFKQDIDVDSDVEMNVRYNQERHKLEVVSFTIKSYPF